MISSLNSLVNNPCILAHDAETETFEKPTAVVVVIRSHTTQLLLQKTPE
ncbi:hypothetical protein MtrunA17_Chr4g0069961 [Medicago truncatula]|uniref:Uncharacterized protein n=1 Tax=Medicago truncatula TaxID=3880 RepID=A0A396II55_MEDTR|nr:hypothetical protein MtrunA17_Chr4g0069961 [Medicago truncatula]